MKKTNKRWSALAIVCALVLSCFSGGFVNKTKAFIKTSGFWQYYPTADGIVITKYTGAETTVNVPAKIEKRPVVEVKGNVLTSGFSGDKWVTTINLPSSVKRIGEGAFAGLTTLKKVNGMQNVESVDSWAFLNCTSLPSLDWTDKLSFIGFEACKGCSAVTSVKIPAGVTRIREGAFEGCTCLKSVEVPDNVQMDNDVFFGCTSLVSATVGKNTSVSFRAFKDCTSLKNVTLKEGEIAIWPGAEAFMNCNSLEEITFPSNYRCVETDGFAGCKNLKKVNLKFGLIYIGKRGFENCDSLVSLVLPNSLETIDKGAFAKCDMLESVTIPKSIRTVNNYYNDTGFSKATIYGYADTSAQKVAEEYKWPFVVLDEVKSTGVKLNHDKTIYMETGEFKMLKFTITPSNTTDYVTFYSSDSKIATVNNVGDLTAVKEGSVTIVAETASGGHDSVNVIVKQAPTELKFSSGAKTIVLGHKVKYPAKASDSKGSRPDVIPNYKSSDTNVVKVSEKGELTAVGVGTATITATTGKLTAKTTITVVGMTVCRNSKKKTLTITTIPKAKVKVTAKKKILGKASKTVTASKKGVAKIKFKKPIYGVKVKITATKSKFKKQTMTLKY